MNKTFTAIALSLMFVGLPTMALALNNDEKPASPAPSLEASEHDQLAMMRASIRLEKRDFIKNAMDLDEAESKAFWPVYYKYEAELMKLYDIRQNTIEEYAKNIDDITESKADDLAKRGFDFRKARLNLLEKYYGKIGKALSKRMATRFVQVENVLLAAGDVTIGTSIPMMPKVNE